MVVWLVRCFFLLLALAVVVWLVDTVYNRTLPRQQMGAVVAQKSWTTFPRTIVWVRRDRKDCSVVFQLPDMGSNMTPVRTRGRVCGAAEGRGGHPDLSGEPIPMLCPFRRIHGPPYQFGQNF